MTLTAFATNGDTAHILTDTISYTPSGRHLGRLSKVSHLHHLDTAFTARGDSKFSGLAFAHLEHRGQWVATFDDLLPTVQACLQQVWAAMDLSADMTDGTVFLIGWSHRAGEFVAYGFDAKSSFRPWRISGTFMIPTPFAYRPSDFELAMLDGIVSAESFSAWRDCPEPPDPATPEEWLDLGLEAWQTRSLHLNSSRVAIGGSLFLTQLVRGGQLTRKLYEFDDSGEDFLKMVTGTLHPRAQVAPCYCGSDKAFMDCCLDLDLACCDGKVVRDCCMLTVPERILAERDAKQATLSVVT